MAEAQYLVKRREFIGIVNRAWGGGRTASYGKWRTLGSHPDIGAAQAALQAVAHKPGLYEVAIFHRGKLVEKG